MATRGYNGLLVNVVGNEVLVNAGNKWTLHEYQEFVDRSQEDLERAEERPEFILWFNVPIGGIGEYHGN